MENKLKFFKDFFVNELALGKMMFIHLKAFIT